MANRWGKCENRVQFHFIGLQTQCNHKIKRHLLLGRIAVTNLDSILKGRDITLPTKVQIVKVMVFLVVLYSCERCTIRKAKHWRTDAFELWCWMLVVTLPVNARDMRDAGWIPGSGRSPEGGHGNPFQYSWPENPHGQRSLVSYSPKGRRESDMTEAT